MNYSYLSALAGCAIAISGLTTSCQLGLKPEEHFLYPKEAANPNRQAFYNEQNRNLPITVVHIPYENSPVKSRTVLITRNNTVVNTQHTIDFKIGELANDSSRIQANITGQFDDTFTQKTLRILATHEIKNYGTLNATLTHSQRENRNTDQDVQRTQARLEHRLQNGLRLHVQADQSSNSRNDRIIYSGGVNYETIF